MKHPHFARSLCCLKHSLGCCHCSQCRSDPPLPFSSSLHPWEISLDPGLALLSGFDRFCQLKAGLWKGIEGIFTELGRIKGSHHKQQLKISDLFPLLSSTFHVHAERGCSDAALWYCSLYSHCPGAFVYLVFPWRRFHGKFHL